MIDLPTLVSLIPSGLFENVSNAVGIAGFFSTFYQWISQSGQAKTQLTIDSYVDWLRRQEHHTLADAIEGNRQLLELVQVLIEDVKVSVLTAIDEHERNSESRHAQMIRTFQDVGIPDLELRLHRPVGMSMTRGAECQYSVMVNVVNRSRSKANVTGGFALLKIGEELHRVGLDHNYSRTHLAENNGTGQLKFESKVMPAAPVTLECIEVKIAQDVPGTSRIFIPTQNEADAPLTRVEPSDRTGD